MYCVKCRKKTPNDGEATPFVAKNGRAMEHAKCAECGIKKCLIVKKKNL